MSDYQNTPMDKDKNVNPCETLRRIHSETWESEYYTYKHNIITKVKHNELAKTKHNT